MTNLLSDQQHFAFWEDTIELTCECSPAMCPVLPAVFWYGAVWLTARVAPNELPETIRNVALEATWTMESARLLGSRHLFCPMTIGQLPRYDRDSANPRAPDVELLKALSGAVMYQDQSRAIELLATLKQTQRRLMALNTWQLLMVVLKWVFLEELSKATRRMNLLANEQFALPKGFPLQLSRRLTTLLGHGQLILNQPVSNLFWSVAAKPSLILRFRPGIESLLQAQAGPAAGLDIRMLQAAMPATLLEAIASDMTSKKRKPRNFNLYTDLVCERLGLSEASRRPYLKSCRTINGAKPQERLLYDVNIFPSAKQCTLNAAWFLDNARLIHANLMKSLLCTSFQAAVMTVYLLLHLSYWKIFPNHKGARSGTDFPSEVRTDHQITGFRINCQKFIPYLMKAAKTCGTTPLKELSLRGFSTAPNAEANDKYRHWLEKRSTQERLMRYSDLMHSQGLAKINEAGNAFLL